MLPQCPHFPYHLHLPLDILVRYQLLQPIGFLLLTGCRCEGVSNGDGAHAVLRIAASVCNRNLSDAILTPTGFFQAKSVPIVTVTAVLFMSSHRSRLPRHLQLVKHGRSTHASGVARQGRRFFLRSLVEEEKTKNMTEASCSAPAKASDSWMIVYYCK